MSLTTSTVFLRQSFIDYFRTQQHKLMPRSKVCIDDPDLFFVNSGMCQLKDVFLGQRQTDPKFSKLMNSQICLRVGGKHNDLEDVGRDSYHLTCFEMLGNWSIKQYGKSEAIRLAYTYLTQVCHLNPKQMYVTYFQGDDTEGLLEDTETREIWTQYFPQEQIIKGNFKDNFWMMGENGPTGPCTEIHYDLKGNRDASSLVNTGDSEVIEIWNNVFISYNRQQGQYQPLDSMYVDTGMGLERLAMILQNKTSLYQIDAFRYLFGYIQALTGSESYTDCYESTNLKDIAYRICADHIRTCIIALHHGVEFDCTKRGFILRKVFRRMMMHLYLHLNQMTIEPKMNHPTIRGLITDILTYFIENKSEVERIQSQLVEEERLYIGKLRNCKRTYENAIKKQPLNTEITTKLKQTHGLDSEIIQYITQLTIKTGDYS